jgi:hypothetical protein
MPSLQLLNHAIKTQPTVCSISTKFNVQAKSLFFNKFTITSVSPHLDAIKAAVSSCGDQLTPREHAYIRAVLAYASGSPLKAAQEWCTMLFDYPLGIAAQPLMLLAFILIH